MFKRQIYMKQIFDCISDGEIIATLEELPKKSDCLRSQLEIA